MVKISQVGEKTENTPQPQEEKRKVELTEEQKEIMEELKNVQRLAKRKQEELEQSAERLNNPRKLKKPFLQTRKAIPKLIARLRKQPVPLDKELEEPLLEIIKENGYSETLEGVKAGEFIIKTPKGEKSIMLTPDKLVAWKYGDNYYKKWYAYENSMTPLPEDPIHNAEMFRKTTQKLAMNWRDRDESAMINAKTKMWLYIIGAVVIGAILFVSTDFGKDLIANIGKDTVQTVAPTIQQAVVNATTNNAGAITVG